MSELNTKSHKDKLLSIIDEINLRISELPENSEFVKDLYPFIKNFKILNLIESGHDQYYSTKYCNGNVYLLYSKIAEMITIFKVDSNKKTIGFVYKFRYRHIGTECFFKHKIANCYLRFGDGTKLESGELQDLAAQYNHFPFLCTEEIIHWRLSR